ncbi:MAG: hypothetical protein UU73_C0003G0138 [Candidatus Daviesbacteria bacterium GW2011_GWA1_41_61]|uniref:HEPN domain-containing protein n=1 Tax=Candidatus Daviesbacteria bacterium GW2011_GWA2_40_9 TaxID=1618424 RepID=A0A0G0WFV9_9BACT|nr:MAG: hypothetical protein UU26_C0003G0088 [Candidatus Daviesbacteria bacterium GW2011_GWC1_40_9]KKR83165.1 MAG: hypothetical protein UU29_C0007G0035 [Candidatus Daviesbacteria bacterium GW2011_GWA2_40_9]KKR93512.1 MAG: hypothetical protein UU44_C0002G0173 [Candidatus Daviesbacteria bacterium GW2011_GWB1_41_15]KKS14939.1 MAG: hypothetical protein UU73_C0003G0138 [Candidatus Daviesbacteria bacterium GW2011_GWA1_41_61]
MKICTEHDLEFNKFSEASKLLNPFYIVTRYPDFVISVNKSDAENALKIAEEIADLVKLKLSA